MQRSPRAAVFDLDDTLYPLRRFVLSGFAAVARYVERQHGCEAKRVFAALQRSYRRGTRGRELQACLDHLELPPGLLPELLAIIRTHRPALRLPASASQALRALRPHCRLGIVTNGPPPTQANKVRALGLLSMVDEVVYAAEHGTGGGKPDSAPFQAVLARLGVEPQHAVFVGDDEVCDVLGASRAGLRTVRLLRSAPCAASAADAVVGSLREIPDVLETLWSPAWSQDVA